MHIAGVIYGYAAASTENQSNDAQVRCARKLGRSSRCKSGSGARLRSNVSILWLCHHDGQCADPANLLAQLVY